MPVDWGGLFALIGPLSIAIAMTVMALLSRRLVASCGHPVIILASMSPLV